jgi:hypothetical protein
VTGVTLMTCSMSTLLDLRNTEWMNVENFGNGYVSVVRQTTVWVFTGKKIIEQISAAVEFVCTLSRHITAWCVYIGMSDKHLNDYLRPAGNSTCWTGGGGRWRKCPQIRLQGMRPVTFNLRMTFELQTWAFCTQYGSGHMVECLGRV